MLAALAVAFASLRAGGGLVIGALGLGFAVRPRALVVRPPLRLLVLIVAGQLIATLLAFLVTDYSPVLQVQLSATRLVEQWLPLALFGVAVWVVHALAGPRGGSRPAAPILGPVE